jgi:quinol-cytochrome oxidoreductase complex cytochrome b subunit
MILASGTTQILLATGAGAFALVVGAIGIFFTLDADDRSKLGMVLRHPVKTIFTEDEPDPDDF